MKSMTGIPDVFPRTLAAGLFVFATSAQVAGEPAGDGGVLARDPHLAVVARSESEAKRIAAVTALTSDFSQAERFEERSAGKATARVRRNRDAFSQPSANMAFDRQMDFRLGDALFEKIWVSSPSSTKASDGLGPFYNARACQRCHVKDGRGHPPEDNDDNAISMFLRVSVPGGEVPVIEGYHPTQPHPNYGGQLQDATVGGLMAEYRLEIHYEEIAAYLTDDTVTLRKPTYVAADPGYGAFGEEAMFSPRVAPQMIGLGLLEAIPAADILALADPGDADGDGISGRPNVVWSREFDQPMLGRFGLKAGMPTVHEQSAAAFSGDIGISTPLFPAESGDCTAAQSECRNAPHGEDVERDGFEVDQTGMDLVTFYSRNLAVPARRNVNDPQVLRGKEMFYAAGCPACHRPKFVTHRLEDRPEQSFQLIWPYTDMLLHDMGDGLADNRPEAVANGREWRTPPLWGIGLTKQVSGHSYFLHDGRARSLLEAVLWHGGEGQAARDAFAEMPSPDRAALIAFLESL
ncbi:di-heme oxidoredictase family protein [uncultured Pelagimonas sp.]|uniref:di-heme oxidoreductase family protein n=1 Tax=uncultured Pelagimonas sp. TaxID=1618102 RepID=UPI002618CB8D|nr:di-heme oxidoredictase family protein [uncultured Pelagimonas sp.]